MPGNEHLIELIVSNNASTDHTDDIVERYRSQGLDFKYVKNEKNILEWNLAQCYSLATAKYVLVLADDDVLVDDALNRILDVLRSGEYGIVHLQAYPYQTDFAKEFPRKQRRPETIVYDNLGKFIKRVNYYFTFISGNIVNKTLVDKNINIGDFNGTNMVQLSWIFSALFNSQRNVYVGQNLIAAKGGNSGGYQICRVFGTNLNKVFEYFIERGIPRTYLDIINRNLVFSLFPNAIRGLRKDMGKYHEENYFKTLYPIFGRYVNFWLFTVPAIVLPLPAVRWWLRVIRNMMKISQFFGKLNDAIIHNKLK
jgi:glycosyltransferase involved in cell wall biosynthesis